MLYKSMVLSIFICLIFSSIIAVPHIDSNGVRSEKYAKYREMYAKPIAQWDKPEIEVGIEYKEFAPLPQIAPTPKENPFSIEKAKLGEKLFNDPKLSKSGQISCSSCHNAELGFGDGLKVSIGHNRQVGKRNAPNIQMSGFFQKLFWDGRADSLESQVFFPITDSKEMANTLENILASVRNNQAYYADFVLSFGNAEQKQKWIQSYPELFKENHKVQVPPILAEKQLREIKTESNPMRTNLGILSEYQIREIQEQAQSFLGTEDFHTIIYKKPQDSQLLTSNQTHSIHTSTKQDSDKIDSIITESAKLQTKISRFDKKEAMKLITLENIAKAIATYERSLVPQNTRFNQFLNGDYAALSDEEMYGLHIFRTKGKCMNCHYGVALSDSKFHNLNLAFYGRKSQDLGRYEITGDKEDLGAFKTPSLINVAKSAPYMHNGVSPNLLGLLHLYDMSFPMPLPKEVDSKDALLPKRDKLITRLNLTTDELLALEAFLKSL